MKKLIIAACLLCVTAAIIAQTVVAVGQWVVVNSAIDPPVALTNTVVKAKRVTFIGRKANRTDNTGTVWIGWSTNNDVQAIKIQAGEVVSPLIPENTVVDLSKIYLDVETANDGVLILYE